jgi:hypothetical protein
MKSKTFFSIFIAMATIPFALALLVLKMGWFTPGATNKGEFVPFNTTLDFQHEKPTWAIIYQPKNACDSLCEEQLYGLNQTYIALGKLQKRVRAYVLAAPKAANAYSHLDSAALTNTYLQPDHLYLVDPLGKVIMQYKGSEDRNETIQTSKDLLSDMKKLLKYARVG